MKPGVLAVLLFVLVPGVASAQVGGAICFFADPAGSDCSLSDTTPGTLTIHVVHTGTPGATAVQFSAPKPACMVGATWLDDTWVFPVTIGDSQTAVSIGYGTCQPVPVHILSINYLVSGTTTPDCAYRAGPAASKFDIEVLDCAGNLLVGNGGTTYINSNLACECSSATPGIPLLAVSPAALEFGAVGPVQTLQIANNGGGSLGWQILRDEPWILIDPPSGTGDAAVSVWISRAGTVGSRTGTLKVVSNGGTINVPVSARLIRAPLLHVDPTSLDFGDSATDLSFNIQNFGTRTLNWSLNESVAWLTPVPISGSDDAVVNVHVDRNGLAPGFYTGKISVLSNGGNDEVSFSMTVLATVPILGVSPTVLSLPMGTDSLPFTISNRGVPGLQWNITSTVPWLTAEPVSGTDGAHVFARVDRTGLGNGTFAGNLDITSNGGSARILVTATVLTEPVLSVSPALNFSSTVSQQSLTIQNVGAGTLQWSLGADQSWIDIVPPLNGTGGATVTVNVDPDSVPGDQRFGSITVSSNGGTAAVNVTFTRGATGIAGSVGAYSDATGIDCDIQDRAPGMFSVFIVHEGTPGATAAQFSAPMPACMTGAIWLSDQPAFPATLGNSQQGIAVAYGTCQPAPVHVLTIHYFGAGTSAACCMYPVLPDPRVASGQVEAVDCGSNLLVANSTHCVINPDSSCLCRVTPVEETTWGQVKAMYHGPGTFRPQKK